MSWSLSAAVPAWSALIFDTATAAMTTSARIIAPNARPRRYARRRSLKRDMLPPGKQRWTRGRRDWAPALPGSSTARVPGERCWPRSGRGVRAARSGERLADRLDDTVGLERLDDEVLGAELDRLEHLRLLAEGRAHHDAGRRVGG